MDNSLILAPTPFVNEVGGIDRIKSEHHEADVCVVERLQQCRRDGQPSWDDMGLYEADRNPRRAFDEIRRLGASAPIEYCGLLRRRCGGGAVGRDCLPNPAIARTIENRRLGGGTGRHDRYCGGGGVLLLIGFISGYAVRESISYHASAAQRPDGDISNVKGRTSRGRGS